MTRTLFFFLLLLFSSPSLFGQNLFQTVRGTVLDADSKTPLIGVQIIVLGSDPLVGTVTGSKGEYRFDKIPVGRIALSYSYIGYESVNIPDIQLISGKETITNVHLTEAILQMGELVISATKNGAPISEMALLSARAISSEETSRYAGGFNDPARILSNFAGVNNSQDGSADIIVRGNSPKYLQWRLEGVQITNPNHFADPGGTGTNGITALNNNILSTSDFYTGAFPAEFGDALSGVYDVRLRAGNKEKFEGVLGAGIIGTDLTLEGPFKKGYGGSFLINYRFTTTGLIDKLGLLGDIGGIPRFTDGAFKVILPTNKWGMFSVFGLAGSSNISFEDVNPGIWLTSNNRGRRGDISEDFKKQSHLLNTGIQNTFNLNANSYLLTTLAFSAEGIEDQVIETKTTGTTVDHTRINFNSRTKNATYSANMSYHHKLNARNTVQTGAYYSVRNQQFNVSKSIDDNGTIINFADFDGAIGMLRTFVNWKHRFNEEITLVSGLQNSNVFFNNKSTLEPRIAASWQVKKNSAISLGYGLHSTMESIHNYLAKVEDNNGQQYEPNLGLGLLKAHHLVLGYEFPLGKKIQGKIETYYQSLYNLPVENDVNSSFATINENLDIRYVDLVNKGTGRNYGIELTLERAFINNYYYLFNTTIFNSKYKALDGIERNTAFNSNYLINFLFGKEFTKWGKKENQTFAVNGKVFAGGGKRIIPLLRDQEGNLNVDTQNNLYYDNSKAFESYLDDIYTITLTLSYKWQKLKSTQELFLNIDNITNNNPKLSEYYDPDEPNSTGYLTPFGIFPNLLYRVYF